jgi:hypothetical protein
MISLVLAAFNSAGVTDFGAEATQLMGKPRASAHEGGGRPTRLSTILVEPNALGHQGNVFLLQARLSAMFTCFSATDTCVDARLKIFMGHIRPPFWGCEKFETPTKPQILFRLTVSI